MQVQINEIDTLRPSKTQDIYKLNFENKVDYKKVKYLLARIPIRWAANDATKTVYICGKKMEGDESCLVVERRTQSSKQPATNH